MSNQGIQSAVRLVLNDTGFDCGGVTDPVQCLFVVSGTTETNIFETAVFCGLRASSLNVNLFQKEDYLGRYRIFSQYINPGRKVQILELVK